jgi:hypothetical protein
MPSGLGIRVKAAPLQASAQARGLLTPGFWLLTPFLELLELLELPAYLRAKTRK